MSDQLLTPEQAAALHKKLHLMSTAEKVETLELLDRQEHLWSLKKKRQDPIEYARHVYPGFKVGPHHKKLAKIFQDVVSGKKKRVIINIAPRMVSRSSRPTCSQRSF
jgi:hypothetical protein